MSSRKHFSRIELIAATFIIGVVSVAVVPKFTQAGTEEKVSELIEGLEIMRVNLDLYRAEHDGQLPPCGSFKEFQTAMTRRARNYGPYIDDIPVNPFNNLSTVRFDGASAGTGTAGWRFDTKTGRFQADYDGKSASL
jgi:type II secretory pathway pseudopilin PulG